jgi:signal transduction histidine kinase
MAQDLILVVEDNAPLLDGVRDLLEMEGYGVLTAGDAGQALALLQTHRPDLIISDIMMPGMDGYELYEQIRRRSDLVETPFIFLTARGETANVRRGKELGADDYITKPFEEQDLLAAVRGKLSRRRALKEGREEEFAGLKRSILVTLSHEFRTPLTYVVNYAEILGKEGDKVSAQEFRQFMQGIRKGAERLNRLVLDFIMLVELETGEAVNVYNYRRRWMEEVSAWLRTVAKRYLEAARGRGLELVIEVPEGLPTILADEVYLGDALGRLLDNAVKFSRPDGRQIRFTAEAAGDALRISVEDEGVGMRPEDLGLLFKMFRQIDRKKQEQQGTGSGLAICKGIVELHGGRVGVTSQPGVGSTFTVELPLGGPPDRI